MDKRSQARTMYEDDGVTLKEIAKQLDVNYSTVRSWSYHGEWKKYEVEKVDTNDGEEKDEKRTSKGNKRKGKGNPAPKNKFKKRNKAALKHGLDSKYIPKETMRIASLLDDVEPIDMLWGQIKLQYASIIRAQEIMFVANKNDHVEFTKKEMKIESYVDEEDVKTDKWVIEYDNIGAWERHSSYMAAQTRAMAELRNLIKQFVSLADEQDERRLKLEIMQQSIERGAEEIKSMRDNDKDKPLQIEIKRVGDNNGDTD